VNLDNIVAELKNERDRLVRAIAGLAEAALPTAIPAKQVKQKLRYRAAACQQRPGREFRSR